MSELTEEELALLAGADDKAEKPGRRGRKPRQGADHDVPGQEEAAPESESGSGAAPRGPITPVQYGDDGWGDLPVQMRG